MVNVEELIQPNWLVPRKNIEVDQPLLPVKTASVRDLTAAPAPKKMANRHGKEFKKILKAKKISALEKLNSILMAEGKLKLPNKKCLALWL